MNNLENIKNKFKKHKESLMAKYPIKEIAIFGSYARDEQGNSSDLDVMVEFDGKIGIQFIDLADELEQLIGLKVDLVFKKGIKPDYFNCIKPDLIYV
jgi:predicted nucleotidyltransferase